MALRFYKYQGTGNDFVVIDNRQLVFSKNDTKLIKHLCNRKFGIGADGLMLLEPHDTAHFTMVYYNADGNKSSMCGNGGRCMAHFANYLGIVKDTAFFEAVDGMHEAHIDGTSVSLKMNEVKEVEVSNDSVFLDTGSPHHVEWVADVSAVDVFSRGRALRYDRYGAPGANINFAEQISEATFAVRTYERGVEDETLSCGTGVTAVAIAAFETGRTNQNQIRLNTPGGDLTVRFEKKGPSYTEVYLEGPAVMVFKGEWL